MIVGNLAFLIKHVDIDIVFHYLMLKALLLAMVVF